MDTTLENPAYREIFQVAKKKGHTDIYAHYLSTIVVEDIPLTEALKVAELYESAYDECISSGFSEPYSRIYAKEYSSGMNKDAGIARVYAKSYEIKILEGLDHNSAWCFADDYVCAWSNYRGEAFIDESFNEDILPQAEAKFRYRSNDLYSQSEYESRFEMEFHDIRYREDISILDALEHAHARAEEHLVNRKPRRRN